MKVQDELVAIFLACVLIPLFVFVGYELGTVLTEDTEEVNDVIVEAKAPDAKNSIDLDPGQKLVNVSFRSCNYHKVIMIIY